ncbi:hypothetical protein Scep_001818 [Stephania cephalantha]|uniref:Uncharacterized protein n=1 Tax=Stephania cephalantha TaxID=152367 RepID=A0AAP0Q3Q7_9MAGN
MGRSCSKFKASSEKNIKHKSSQQVMDIDEDQPLVEIPRFFIVLSKKGASEKKSTTKANKKVRVSKKGKVFKENMKQNYNSIIDVDIEHDAIDSQPVIEADECSASKKKGSRKEEEEAISMENDDESEYSVEYDSEQDSGFDGEEEDNMEKDGESSL